jgi:hypothetical protein
MAAILVLYGQCGNKTPPVAKRRQLIADLGLPPPKNDNDLVIGRLQGYRTRVRFEGEAQRIISSLSSRGLPTVIPKAVLQVVHDFTMKDITAYRADAKGAAQIRLFATLAGKTGLPVELIQLYVRMRFGHLSQSVKNGGVKARADWQPPASSCG